MKKQTLVFLLLLIVLALVPVSQGKPKNKEKQGKWDVYCKNGFTFIEDNTEVVLSTATLFVILIYLVYDYNNKNQIKNLLQTSTIKSPPQSSTTIQASQKSPFSQQIITQTNQVYLKRQQSFTQTRTNTQFPIYKIVITGGPCGGKTTSLDKMKKQMSQKGFRVFSVPQIPTMVVQGGGMILMSKFTTEEKIRFQVQLIRFQMYAEDYFTKLAEMSKTPSIILCDRGAVDPAAYITKSQFQAVMDSEGWSWVGLRDRRYDQVIFLDSAAVGAEQFYTRSNNTARSEGLQAAKALNQKTLEAWIGHPHLSIITNKKGESFDGKINRSLRALQQTVGLQRKSGTHQKFLIQSPIFPQNLKIQTTQIQQGFLISSDPKFQEDKIKRRTINNLSTYQRKYHTVRNQNGDFIQSIRKPLTALQYVALKDVALDPAFHLVQRKRIHFAYNSISYVVDVFDEINGKKNVCLLRFDCLDEEENPQNLLPDFIKWIKNVKKDKIYNLREIARKK